MRKRCDERTIKLVKLFGENVQRIRLEKGISIKELSEKTGIREKYLKRIEKGEALGLTTLHVFILAEALLVKPHLLVLEYNF